MSAAGGVGDDLALRGDLEIGALGDESAHDRLLPLGDQRPDVEVGVRRADLEAPVARRHPLDDLAIAPALDQDARRGRTGLAGVLDAGVDQERQRAVEVGVGEHELGRFSPEFQRHRGDMARRRRLDQRPDRDRAGEGKMHDSGMGGERRARLLAEARERH